MVGLVSLVGWWLVKLLALLLLRQTGAAESRVKPVPHALADEGTASSQCSGTTSPACQGLTSGSTCTTSSDLPAASCNAWVDFYDNTGGSEWVGCSENRLNPCACDLPNQTAIA